MATSDLREESGVTDRKAFNRGLDELQAAMIVVPSEEAPLRAEVHLSGRSASAGFRTRCAPPHGRAPRDRACFAGAGTTIPGERRGSPACPAGSQRGNRAPSRRLRHDAAPGFYQLARVPSRQVFDQEDPLRRSL